MTFPLGVNDKRKRGEKHWLPASFLSFHFPAEDFSSEAFDGWFVIVGFHCFEGAFQLVHQFGIELAHAESEFHAERLNAGKLINVHHVLEAKVQEFGAKVVFVNLQALDDVQRQPSDGRVLRMHRLLNQLVEDDLQGRQLFIARLSQSPQRTSRNPRISMKHIPACEPEEIALRLHLAVNLLSASLAERLA